MSGRYDGAIGLYYLRNRFYSPALGRFLTPDPARRTHNLYAYPTDPVNLWDPMGLIDQKLMFDFLEILQRATNKLMESKPEYIRNSTDAAEAGRKLHETFQSRINELLESDKFKLLKGFVLTEKGINKSGSAIKKMHVGIQSWWPKGTRVPDIMILKDPIDFSHKVEERNLVGNVEFVIDLKTGTRGIDKKWAEEVLNRLELSPFRLKELREGENLLGEVICTYAAEHIAENPKFLEDLMPLLKEHGLKLEKTKNGYRLKRNLLTVLKDLFKKDAARDFLLKKIPSIAGKVKQGAGPIVAIAFLMLTYESARQQGMSPEAAKMYAASSIFGGDLLYDVTKGGADVYWEICEMVAHHVGSSMIQRYVRAASDIRRLGGPDVNKYLDALFKQGKGVLTPGSIYGW
ncbi:MAG: RHS repeat-associated core domain-containing protein [Methanobacteriota archaeon]|nr:MAG: RHS repeat-associated core domain-containing protein [Euryarchaeota archaeon]